MFPLKYWQFFSLAMPTGNVKSLKNKHLNLS